MKLRWRVLTQRELDDNGASDTVLVHGVFRNCPAVLEQQQPNGQWQRVDVMRPEGEWYA